MQKALVMCLALVVGFGCGGPKSQIVGIWKLDQAQVSSLTSGKIGTPDYLEKLRVEFKSDGTYEAQPAGEKGSYAVKGATITVTPDQSKSEGSVGPATEMKLSADGKTLTIDLGMEIKLTKADG